MIKITRIKNHKPIEVIHTPKGQTLLETLRNQGYDLEAPCSGQGVCGKCKVKVLSGNDYQWTTEEYATLTEEERHLGWRLSCLYVPMWDIQISWDENPTWSANHDTFNFLRVDKKTNPEPTNNTAYGIALDIGTTTVVANLVSSSTKTVIESAYRVNPQKRYGLDVMSRIAHQEESPKMRIALKQIIIACLNELVENLVKSEKLSSDKIKEITIVGNTPMLHLLLGVDASRLGKAPYESQIKAPVTMKAESLGLQNLPKTVVYILPPIKGFVGSDISAGILTSDLVNRSGNILLIDIGTNGEIVLKTDQGMVCCSCAAGPAFEGANISCGMRATAGAIELVEYHFKSSPSEGSMFLKTIADQSPIGICGSGILDLMSLLSKHQLIGKTGRLKSSEQVSEPFSNLLKEDSKGRYFAILGDLTTLKLYQSDIRQIQLAKGAIRSGIEALLNQQGLQPKDITEVLIAGQFGSHIREESLVGTGMLPKDFETKISYIGNSAIKGAEMCLENEVARKQIESLIQDIQYVELSLLQGYDRLFVNCLNFENEEVTL